VRPELIRLIANSRPDDVLLIEQVDRLSRLKRAIGKSSAPILTPSKSVSLRSIFRQVGCWRVRPTTSQLAGHPVRESYTFTPYQDEGSGKLLAVEMGLEPLEPRGGAGNGVLPRSL
jgi:hypothetical protein